MATAAAAPPSLLTQVGMAGTAAVLTVTCIHPIDVIKVRQAHTDYSSTVLVIAGCKHVFREPRNPHKHYNPEKSAA